MFGSSEFNDGPLLRALVGHCDCFVTVDRGIPHQQVISRLPFSPVLLRARSNRLEHLVPLASVLREAVRTPGPGEMAVLGV